MCVHRVLVSDDRDKCHFCLSASMQAAKVRGKRLFVGLQVLQERKSNFRDGRRFNGMLVARGFMVKAVMVQRAVCFSIYF